MTLRGGQESTFDLGGKEIMQLKQFIQELISRAQDTWQTFCFPELADTLGNKSNISLRMSSLFSRVLYLLENKSY